MANLKALGLTLSMTVVAWLLHAASSPLWPEGL